MWEIELIADRSNSEKLHNIIKKINQPALKKHLVTSVMGDEKKVYLGIGVDGECELETKSRVRLALCDMYCEEFKYEFVRQNLNTENCEKEMGKTLEKLCTYFDRETERAMVLELLELNKPKLNIESFYQFKLRGLRQKWMEFCELLNNSVDTVTKPTNFVEFVQFLMGGIDNRCKSLILDLKEGCIAYKDEGNEVDVFLGIDTNYKYNILVKLVELNPLEVVVCAPYKQKDLVAFITQIFTNRVRIKKI